MICQCKCPSRTGERRSQKVLLAVRMQARNDAPAGQCCRTLCGPSRRSKAAGTLSIWLSSISASAFFLEIFFLDSFKSRLASIPLQTNKNSTLKQTLPPPPGLWKSSDLIACWNLVARDCGPAYKCRLFYTLATTLSSKVCNGSGQSLGAVTHRGWGPPSPLASPGLEEG